MPWYEEERAHTNGLPPWRPDYEKWWTRERVFRAGPEDYPDELELSRQIALKLRASTSPDAVARLLDEMPRAPVELLTDDSYRDIWMHLVSNRAVGAPTHDLVLVSIRYQKGGVFFAGWDTDATNQAWAARGAAARGVGDGAQYSDRWIDDNGNVWTTSAGVGFLPYSQDSLPRSPSGALERVCFAIERGTPFAEFKHYGRFVPSWATRSAQDEGLPGMRVSLSSGLRSVMRTVVADAS